MRVLLGILAGAGLRIGEALALRWQHVDLATGTVHVVEAKSTAGVRSVDLTPALREELVLWRAESEHVELDNYGRDNFDGPEAQPLQPAPRRAQAGGRESQRRARQERHRAD
jgi:integrase